MTTPRSAARRPPAPRPELPELHPGEAVVVALPNGRDYRLAQAADGSLALVTRTRTCDAAPSLAVVRRLATARLTR